MTNDLVGMYTDYNMAEEAVYTLGQLAEAIDEQLNEHSDADPRWKIRLESMREHVNALRDVTDDLWREWALETGEIDG